jgi:type VI secretion system protein ImpH
MRTTQRRFDPSVIERLFEQPYRFQYFQAVRMLELWLHRNGPCGAGAVARFLRFQNSLALTFAPSELEDLQTEPRSVRRDRDGLAQALQGGELKYIRLTPAFMGLLGTAGALPAHYTESIAAHQLYHKDEGPRAFLDQFSNRALALFYEAWRKYRLELQYERPGRDEFLPLLLALAGAGNDAARAPLSAGGGRVIDESLAYFAAALRQRPASAVHVANVLSDYFGQQIAITQFAGCWYRVPSEQQTVLGGTNAALGRTAMSGARVWQRDLRMRLTVGPLGRAQFENFLPGGEAALALEKMLAMLTGVALEYEVSLVLRAADVQGISLDNGRCWGRLGWDSFLVTGAQHQDRCDVRYELHTVGACSN